MNFKCIVSASLFSLFLVVSAFAQSDAKKFYELTEAAPATFTAGKMAEASALAKTLLAEAPKFRDDWNYGNAIHVGHLVLGRVALASGDVDEAKRQLLQSAEGFKAEPTTSEESSADPRPSKRYKASPQMDSFGPDMRLAKDLLEKGEKDAVIRYLDLCSTFWAREFDKAGSWKAMIKNGEKPDFGPNLIYFFNER